MITTLPDGYKNLNVRAYQAWNSDAKQFLVDTRNIVDLTPFIDSDFTNGLPGDPTTILKLYDRSDGTYVMRGAVEYVSAPLTSSGAALTTSLTSLFSTRDIQRFENSAIPLVGIDQVTPGAISSLALKWDVTDIFTIEVGADTLATNDVIFIEHTFFPKS